MIRVVAVSVLVAAVLVGCGGGSKADPDPGPKIVAPAGVHPPTALGASEGKLNLLAPAGYVPQDATAVNGCQINVTTVSSSDDLVAKMSSGRYDGGLGTSDAMVRLITNGDIAPINTGLIPNYADVYNGLKARPFNSVAKQLFALPVGRAVRLLVWRRDAIPGTVASLGAILDRPQIAALGEQLVVPDDPSSIAETALWVARQQKDLKITDPYELGPRQFKAVLAVLRNQQPYVNEYWHDPGTVREAFRQGHASIGMAPQQVVAELHDRPGNAGPVDSVRPKEGSIGISPAWMVSAKVKHPNCMYRFMNTVLNPKINGEIAQDTAIAPANKKACDTMASDSYCTTYHADDETFYAKVLYRTYPSSDCGDARGRICEDWETWVKAWKRIMAGT